VPLVWIKNLPPGDGTDGYPTFCDEVVYTGIEIDHLLSQGGRRPKYSLDPTLMIKDPAAPTGELAAGNALRAETPSCWRSPALPRQRWRQRGLGHEGPRVVAARACSAGVAGGASSWPSIFPGAGSEVEHRAFQVILEVLRAI
jgi:hypothetical protein